MDILDTLFRHRILRISNRTYQLLLAAYPSRFRRNYGRHMAQVFRDCCRDAYQQGGSGSVIALWMAAFYDLGTNALGEHVSTLVHDIEEKNVAHALLAGKQGQAKFMISSQQFPDASMFRLLDYSYTARRTGNPQAT
jgi:hypothetical protein